LRAKEGALKVAEEERFLGVASGSNARAWWSAVVEEEEEKG
jgi:hypothetical protein